MHSIIKALGGEEFLAQVFTRTYRRFRLGGVSEVLTWSDLNHLLSCHRLEAPRFRLAHDGNTVAMDEYCQRRTYRRMPNWNAPSPNLVAEQLRDGATLVLDAIEEMHPPIHVLAASIERALRTSVQVNAYASWTAQQGFGVHWDDHDVIVVQLDGAKDWRIYGPTRPSPLFRDVSFDTEPPTDPISEFTLKAGDGVYLPRGWWHGVATAAGERSLHLTFGLSCQTGVDLLAWVVDSLRESVVARGDVPWFADSATQKAWLADVRAVLDQRLDDADVIAAYRAAGDAQHRAVNAFALPYAVTGTIPAEASVRLASSRARVTLGDDHVIVEAAGQRWTLHPRAHPIVKRISGGEPVCVADLAESAGLAVGEVQKLLTEFLAAGVLTVEVR